MENVYFLVEELFDYDQITGIMHYVIPMRFEDSIHEQFEKLANVPLNYHKIKNITMYSDRDDALLKARLLNETALSDHDLHMIGYSIVDKLCILRVIENGSVKLFRK